MCKRTFLFFLKERVQNKWSKCTKEHFFLSRAYKTTGQNAQNNLFLIFKGDSTKQLVKMHKKTLLFKERVQNNWSKCTKEHTSFEGESTKQLTCRFFFFFSCSLQNVGSKLLSVSFISCDLWMVRKVENAYREEVGSDGAVLERLWDLNLIWAVASSLPPLSPQGVGGGRGGGFECLVLTQ